MFPKEWTRDSFPAWLLFADAETKRAFELHVAQQAARKRKPTKRTRKVVNITEAIARREAKKKP